MSKFMVFIITMEMVAFLLIVLGALVGFKKKITLVAGINKDNLTTIKNPEKVSKLVGYSVIVIGVLTSIMPLAIYYLGSKSPFFTYIAIVILIIVNMFTKTGQYQK
jgi:hypothetical protein